ncbi:MAG: glucosyltransferase domain-containing protein [Lachnospiraceae bacterium]|nr:glucosyltransferase domain-containing protein [Lachnospiraceae bacterium]
MLQRINKRELLYFIEMSFLFGLVAHAFAFFNYLPSHDALNAVYASPVEDRLKYYTGRFCIPLLRKLFGPLVLPWVVGAVSLFLVACSAYFVCRILKINKKLHCTLVIAIMSTNLTMTTMYATYSHEMIYDMLALFLACYAAYAICNKCLRGGYIQAVLCVVIIAGLYQSYVFTITTLILLNHILLLMNGARWKETFISGCKQIILIAIGVLIYFILYYMICYFMQINMDPTKSMSDTNQLSFLSQILFVYRKAIRNLVFPYSILPVILVSGSSCILIGITIFKLIKNFWKNSQNNKKRIKEFILMIILIIVFPITSIGIAIINSYIHECMIYALWFTYCFAFAVIENQTENQPDIKTQNKMFIFVAALISILIFNNILIANTCYLKKSIEDRATLSVMTRVVDDLEDRDDYKMGETKLMFYGTGPYYIYLDGFEDVYQITGVDFKAPIYDSNLWYYNCYQAYFDYVLDYPAQTVSYEEFESMLHLEEVRSIPAFPDKDYIQNINGVLVVNMGN